MARLMVGDEDEKLRAAFRAYDTDESGTKTKLILPRNLLYLRTTSTHLVYIH